MGAARTIRKNSKIIAYTYRWVALISLIALAIWLLRKCGDEFAGYNLAKYGTPDTSTEASAASDLPAPAPAEIQPADTSSSDQSVDLSDWSAICDNGLEHYGDMPRGSLGWEIGRTFQITEDSAHIYHLNMWDVNAATPFWRKDCFGAGFTFDSLPAAQSFLRFGVDKLLDAEAVRENQMGQQYQKGAQVLSTSDLTP